MSAAGFSAGSCCSGTPEGIADGALGGGLPAQIEYTTDGISTHSSWSGPNGNMYPSTESLSEFKVTSVSNNAEFGQMGDVTVVTRGGANRMHGSALWYHQNAALDAAEESESAAAK